MIRDKSLRYALLLALGVCLATSRRAQPPLYAPQAAKPGKSPGKPRAPAVTSVLKPKTIELLKAARDPLAAASRLLCTGLISYERPALVWSTRQRLRSSCSGLHMASSAASAFVRFPLRIRSEDEQ